MQSLDNTYSEEELAEFVQRVQKLLPARKSRQRVEPKVDGVAISLLYENGRFTRATTRGDGNHGRRRDGEYPHDLRSIPMTLGKDAPARIEIRGEVYLPKKELPVLTRSATRKGVLAFRKPSQLRGWLAEAA